MYTLFAYTRDPAQRIVRFSVDREVQVELTAYLEPQVQYFDREREVVEFDGKYKPDDHELLVIREFEDIDNLAAAIGNPITVPIADPAEFSFEQIKALFFGRQVDGQISVYLQNFDRRKLISDTGFSIFHSQNVYKRIEGTGLTLDSKISAKLQGDNLQFFSFFHISRMFDMTNYYQEATDTDIVEFAALEQVSVRDQAALIQVSDTWVRRKLWLIKQSGILERVPSNDIRRIAAEFGIAVNYEVLDGAEKLVMPVEKKDLKTLLRFLDEDYYKSPLSNTNFITNSKRRADGPV
jgi:hypothetical protein